jgi:hypothetical protein
MNTLHTTDRSTSPATGGNRVLRSRVVQAAAVIVLLAVVSALPALGHAFPAGPGQWIIARLDALYDWVVANRNTSPIFLYGFNYISLLLGGAVAAIQGLLDALTWVGVVVLFGFLSWRVAGWRVLLVVLAAFAVFGLTGLWDEAMLTLALIAAFGEPTEEARRHHRALLAGVERACELIRPGVRAAQVFEAAVETVRREGIGHYRRNHVGHGIGIDGYDAPSLTATSDEILEGGMVLCVETPYYELGRWGLQVEDMVVVRADGVERLTATSGDLMMVAP